MPERLGKTDSPERWRRGPLLSLAKTPLLSVLFVKVYTRSRLAPITAKTSGRSLVGSAALRVSGTLVDFSLMRKYPVELQAYGGIKLQRYGGTRSGKLLKGRAGNFRLMRKPTKYSSRHGGQIHSQPAWVSQQLRDTFPYNSAPRYLILKRSMSEYVRFYHEKSGRTSVPGSRARTHFSARHDFLRGCRRASFGSQFPRIQPPLTPIQRE